MTLARICEIAVRSTSTVAVSWAETWRLDHALGNRLAQPRHLLGGAAQGLWRQPLVRAPPAAAGSAGACGSAGAAASLPGLSRLLGGLSGGQHVLLTYPSAYPVPLSVRGRRRALWRACVPAVSRSRPLSRPTGAGAAVAELGCRTVFGSRVLFRSGLALSAPAVVWAGPEVLVGPEVLG